MASLRLMTEPAATIASKRRSPRHQPVQSVPDCSRRTLQNESDLIGEEAKLCQSQKVLCVSARPRSRHQGAARPGQHGRANRSSDCKELRASASSLDAIGNPPVGRMPAVGRSAVTAVESGRAHAAAPSVAGASKNKLSSHSAPRLERTAVRMRRSASRSGESSSASHRETVAWVTPAITARSAWEIPSTAFRICAIVLMSRIYAHAHAERKRKYASSYWTPVMRCRIPWP
jgi:hypothetical protein